MVLKKNKLVPKVLICSNYAWTVFNFRLPLIKKMKALGYKVVVITQFDGYEEKIKKDVDQILPLFISRKGVNPFIDTITFLHLVITFFRIKPHYILLFTIKPVIYGTLAAKFFGIKSIVMITGLGTSFIINNWITSLVKLMYKFSLKSAHIVFFQNSDDKDLFLENKLINPKVCKMIPGSGIDTSKFRYIAPKNNKKVTFLLIARMLWDKGVGEYVKAARIIKLKYPNTIFQLLGPLGVQNRTAISEEKMNRWEKEGYIEYLGATDDVMVFIKRACCVVLPSYREGISRVLLEAASIGRPIIASDVPGCREVVNNKINGFLCVSRDYQDLAQKIEAMINLSYENRKTMGIKGREKIKQEFSQEIVNRLFLEAINK